VSTLIGVAGIAFSVAAMLTVVTILQGAIGMFERILSNDSEIIVFERNVSDLFFSSVPDGAVGAMSAWPMVRHARPVLFGIVTSADHPIITCFGVEAADARIRETAWVSGNRDDFGKLKCAGIAERQRIGRNFQIVAVAPAHQQQLRITIAWVGEDGQARAGKRRRFA